MASGDPEPQTELIRELIVTGNPEPQTELIRELIVTGNLEQLKGVMDVEVSLWHDRAFRYLRHNSLFVVGPVVHGASTIWLFPSGSQADLFLVHDRDDEMITLRWAFESISVSPDMTLQQIWDQAIVEHLDLSLALHLGLLRAIRLPEGRLRLLFAVGGFLAPRIFWRWVDGMTAELDRLGFHAAGPSSAPPLKEPGSPTSTHQDPLAGESAVQTEPWLQIPDYRWDRQALKLWWDGFTITEIADQLSYTEKTIRNRFSTLRVTYGTNIVPTAAQLAALK